MARMIPKKTLEEIRFRNDIVDVVGEHITLKRAGSTFKANCPFHKEKTPSFTVNQQRQIYHCFGCGAGGDVFSFIREIEGVDFTMAAELLARRAGMQVEFEDSGGAPASERELLYKIHEEAARFYQRCLTQTPTGDEARRYIEDRELPAETVEQFLIGYAPASWDASLRWGEKHGYPPEQLLKAGLVVQSTGQNNKTHCYDRFRDRLMFPIRDVQGRVVAFSGRVLEKNDKGAKYVNSPETDIFRKSYVLYALDKARKAIVSAEAREAIICEGQIDVIRCHQAGFNTAVASQGTAFTPDHARLLKRYADGVVIVFDPDVAGQNASVKTAALFIEAGLAVRVAALPEGEDPDAFIRTQGAAAFQSVLDRAESAVAFQIHVLAAREDLASEVGLMRVSKAVLETIARCPGAVQQATLLQVAADLLKTPRAALQADLNHLQRRARPAVPASQVDPPDGRRAAAPAAPKEEKLLCAHLVQAPDAAALTRLVADHLPLDLVSDAHCRAMLKAILQAHASDRDIQTVLRQSGEPDDDFERFTSAVLAAPSRVAGQDATDAEAVKDLILSIWKRWFERERKGLPEDHERFHDLTRCIELFRAPIDPADRWNNCLPIIKIEMAERRDG